MIEFRDALESAKKYYAKTNEVVAAAWNHPKFWLFYGDTDDGLVQYGGCYLRVDKTSGETTIFYLPSAEGFELMDAAIPLDLEL